MKKQRSLAQLKPTSANNLTKAIISYVTTVKGGFATRINTQGQYDPRLKLWRPGATVKGMSDILIVLNGYPLFVEVKVGKDRQSKEQKEFEKTITKAGAHYFVASTLDGFIEWERKLWLC